ncbi:TetR family transcriptional regulator [Streptomyces sp. Amel2xB2]|uniref:TetR/AcrR family transcriptional regulator n=1 Tax=Streptomyces sp. Amel2xB2 TaxID=1305829 RepID=UPI000DBA1745|nr:TetR/AcrR family transcriptional regulator C-terminal domain-containing protein [Streptomyces sp. Amel2xB2]RAJ67155.1 TetR family transcriptional regulator [Streptomyces sp. Amel2xB2]
MARKRVQTGSSGPGAVWLREQRPVARAPALSPDRIVAAAVGALDRDGVAGLSMRKLADSFDVHATSLYWHISSREELLDLALDAVFGEVALPQAHFAQWRDDVALFMRELRRVLLLHPWSAAQAGIRPLLGPNALARFEFVYTALVTAGFSGADLPAASAAISNFVIGSAAAEAAWRHGSQATDSGAVSAHLRRIGEHYPTLSAHVLPLGSDWDERFARGTDFLLTGLAVSRDAPHADPPQPR